MSLSPMMQHYVDTKENYKDCILFYRLGDFYEMFFDDAKTCARELELTLTGKSCGLEERAPMCGVPFKAADTYIAKLVEKGYKVAICEQVEDPAEAKGIVKREVIKIVTPGTITSGSMLNEKENNYLASVYFSKDGMSISYCDISTGELNTTEEYMDINIYDDIVNELVTIDAKEIIINSEFDLKYGLEDLKKSTCQYVQVVPDSYFSDKAAKDLIKNQLGQGAISSSGLLGRTLCIRSLEALFTYLLETQKQALTQITLCNFYEMGKHMSLDKATLRNLEITETLYEKKLQGSLLGVLDKTKTAMGSRKLKKWLREPLNNAEAINYRLDGVEEIFNQSLIENHIREHLSNVYDFERLAGRIASKNANGKDLLALKSSLMVLPEIKYTLQDCQAEILKDLGSSIYDLKEICQLIEDAISEEAGYTIKEGDIIKEGFSKELDDLKFSISDAKDWIASLENRERERTGIKTLKVGFNKVFGYYLEVPSSQAENVPEEYIRKQTLVKNERFITPDLKTMENKVLNAETKINKMEYDIFVEVRDKIEEHIKEIQETSSSIATIDVLCSYSNISRKAGYVKPIVDNSLELEIKEGRHPVVEQTEDGGMFVANDTYLNDSEDSFMLITGPNMSGKSTYMRQTALIVLMAQAGCFVPCDFARIGVVDRIFTRIGASDNLSQGQSTFYVEMSELAYILNCSTKRSLVILDEIGRGTSTYDGLAIAWACTEYLCSPIRQVRTLFATHYHELTDLENTIKGVKNLNVDVAEEQGNIIFLHKIVPGSASRSYGIHVAKLAGVPKTLLIDAQKKLDSLEAKSKEVGDGLDIGDFNDSLTNSDLGQNDQVCKESNTSQQVEAMNNSAQLSFMPDLLEETLTNKLKNIDLMEVTPSQAIKILEELKGILDD